MSASEERRAAFLAARARARAGVSAAGAGVSAAPAGNPDPTWPRSNPLRGTPVAVVDVETTGSDPLEARIVELAVVHTVVGAHEAELVLNRRVNPGIPIPADTSKVHGITDADVADCPPFLALVEELRAALRGRVPCAYNVPYDATVIGHELAGVGFELEVPALDWLDPLVLVKGIDQFEKGKRLRDAARRRGILVDAHGAAGDATTTALLLTALLDEASRGVPDRNGRIRFRSPVEPTVDAFLRWQRTTALAQERDFVAYIGSSGGRRDPVDCPWHRLEGLPEPSLPKPPAPSSSSSGPSSCTCGASVVLIVAQGGRRILADAPPLRGVHGAVEGSRDTVLVTDTGDLVRCDVVPESYAGPVAVEGRELHSRTCRLEQPRWSPR